MADFLTFLDNVHPVHKANALAWAREERRLAGGDGVLTELVRWKGETEDHHTTVRKPMAGYLPFPEAHAGTLSGHLNRKYPEFNYGSLGEVRAREEVDTPTLAELFDYNCDGIGNDGASLRSFMDGVEQRAIATGQRWLMLEMPSRTTLAEIRLNAVPPRNPDALEISEQDRMEGFRPYLVERLLTVKNWRLTNGVLQYAVIREKLPVEDDLDDTLQKDGYYVLVRKGYRGLGATYAEGGWWWFDADKAFKDHGTWDATFGQIPMWPLYAKRSNGTPELPAMSRSLTMELGQIAVGLMNLRSTRDFNLIQAGKSVTYILGGDELTHKVVIKQHEDGTLICTVPAVMGSDGRSVVPTLWNSAEAAVASGAFKAVIESGIAEAKEIMVRQVTSGMEASGVSRDNAFAEAVSPLLANLAGNREASDNNLLQFLAWLFGEEADGSVTWPTEFPIRDVLLDIDSMLDTLRRVSLSSPTWEQDLLIRKGDQLGLVPEDEREKIIAELKDAAEKKIERAAQADSLFGGLEAMSPEESSPNGGARIPAEVKA